MSIERLEDAINHAIGAHEHNMRRDRQYNGQPHTSTGERGATEIKGITFRDLRDAYVRAMMLSQSHINLAKYNEAQKGENAVLCEQDLYGWDSNLIDPMAVMQNLSCEIEKLMGIYPNVPKLQKRADDIGPL